MTAPKPGSVRVWFRMTSSYSNTFSIKDLEDMGCPTGDVDEMTEWLETFGDTTSENAVERDCDFGSVVVSDVDFAPGEER